MDAPDLLIIIFVAATIPMVAAIFAALLPSARAKSVDSYFLYDRSLDIDGFLKTSVGYSLQAASIILFFTWGLSYGLYSVFVPAAWGAGYFLVAYFFDKGKFNNFLKNDTSSEQTIHGHVWSRLKTPDGWTARLAIFFISLATVCGIGGTLIAEVDYGAKLFLTATKITKIAPSMVTAIIVAFATFYILWGGYRAVVITDKIQVPLAYSVFGAVSIGSAYLLLPHSLGRGISAFFFLLFCLLLYNRLKLLQRDDYHNRSVAWLTFFPLAALSLAVCFFPTINKVSPSINVYEILFPSTPDLLGFGLVGLISLFLANIVWQLIDISSLQRLQSLKINATNRPTVIKALRATGVEAACGWLLILATALALRALGLTDISKLVELLGGLPGYWNLLLPALIFSAVVFVLSTVSGFVSSIAFVAYFDFLALIGLHSRKLSSDDRSGHALAGARTTTLIFITIIFLAYQILKLYLDARAKPGEDPISQALYAIYAFQLAITPTVLYVLLVRPAESEKQLNPLPVLLSCLTGLIVAWFSATAAQPIFGIPDASWYVVPPLFVISTSIMVFVIFHKLTSWLEQNRAVD